MLHLGPGNQFESYRLQAECVEDSLVRALEMAFTFIALCYFHITSHIFEPFVLS